MFKKKNDMIVKKVTACSRRWCLWMCGGAVCAYMIVAYLAELSPKRVAKTTRPRSEADNDRTGPMLAPEQKINIRESLFEGRNTHLLKKCRELSPMSPSSRCSVTSLRKSVFFLEGKDIAYCAVEKTGSTFWKRILHSTSGNKSLFEIQKGFAQSRRGNVLHTFQEGDIELVKQVVRESSSFLFVRDPYTRTMSGWYDKLYTPHQKYWPTLGTEIIKAQRKNATEASLQCGFDVTFVEYIRHLTQVLSNPESCFDEHFIPMYDHCFPCSLTYDYIGKYETIDLETKFLLQKFNLTDNVQLHDLEENVVLMELHDSAAFFFKGINVIKKCTKLRCALFRLFRRFQGRGMIDIRIPFPITTDEEANNLTLQGLKDILTQAYRNSSLEGLQMNKSRRREALSQAFSTLDAGLLQRFKEVFRNDFELFDYNTESPDLGLSPTFDYLEPCPSVDKV